MLSCNRINFFNQHSILKLIFSYSLLLFSIPFLYLVGERCFCIVIENCFHLKLLKKKNPVIDDNYSSIFYTKQNVILKARK